MYVKDRMTKDPYCINTKTSISAALDIMSSHNFHRLPVVDENNHLVGLITEGVITENTPGKATSLSIYELNYLLSKSTVEDIMIKQVITIDPDVFLEEAAVKMQKNNVGCLVVLDKETSQVIGIITHNDIFSAFIDLLGYNQKGIRYVLKMENDCPGEFAKVTDYIAKMNVNISNIAVYHTVRGIEVVLATNGDNCHRCKDGLEKAGYVITDILETE